MPFSPGPSTQSHKVERQGHKIILSDTVCLLQNGMFFPFSFLCMYVHLDSSQYYAPLPSASLTVRTLPRWGHENGILGYIVDMAAGQTRVWGVGSLFRLFRVCCPSNWPHSVLGTPLVLIGPRESGKEIQSKAGFLVWYGKYSVPI